MNEKADKEKDETMDSHSLCSLAIFKQVERGGNQDNKPQSCEEPGERDNWETACTDGRYFLLVQYVGVWAIAIG